MGIRHLALDGSQKEYAAVILDRILLSALRVAMNFRCDGQPQLDYFPASAYGANEELFSFHSGKNLLRGGKYFVPRPSYRGVVVFFHGVGAGRSAYTQEICAFAKEGYLVYAYDNTGCMTSEGQGIGNLAQSLLDQKAFFAFLDEQKEVAGLPRYAVGHSWGGYTAFGAMNPAYHVDKVISISGFVSLPKMLISQAPALGKFEGLLKKALKRGYGSMAGEEMTEIIAKSNAKLLYIQGELDTMVPKKGNYDVLERRFQNDERVRLRLVKGAMHNPYWDHEAERYSRVLGKDKRLFARDYDVTTKVCYEHLNHDDPAILREMFDFLEEERP